MNKKDTEFLKRRAIYCKIHDVWYSNELSKCPMCSKNIRPSMDKKDLHAIKKEYIKKTSFDRFECCMCGKKIPTTIKYHKENGTFCKNCLEQIDRELEWRQLYGYIKRLKLAIKNGVVDSVTKRILKEQVDRKEYLEDVLLKKYQMSIDILIKNNEEAIAFKEQLK